ncbi:MAG: glpE [Candidatus Midichloriaceae bacterium]|jgi:rhodanese-related sulfurtransferase|nr:glpE [Candidatus Midichloriaceae bacterium]
MLQLYRGDLSPKNSWELLYRERDSYVVDVRTQAEWRFVGVPDLGELEDRLIKIEWRSFPNMEVNANFAAELMKVVANKASHLIFMCRTGARSREAANFMANLGYINCYNVLYGFEGDLDENGHRGNISGWKAEKLAWRQD